MPSVTTVISRIRRRLEDADGLHWPDTEVIGAINEAKNDLYDYVFTRNRDVFDTVSVNYTWKADKMNVPLQDIYGSEDLGTYDIILVSSTPTTDGVSESNRPVPLRRINFEELYRHGSASSVFYDDYQYLGYTYSGGSWIPGSYADGRWSGGGGGAINSFYRWAQQGFTVYVDPIPKVDVQLRFEIIKRFKEFDEAGTQNSSDLFPNDEAQFTRWARIVEYSAALVLKGRSDEREDPLLGQLQSKYMLLNAWLDSKSNTGTPRVVINGY